MDEVELPWLTLDEVDEVLALWLRLDRTEEVEGFVSVLEDDDTRPLERVVECVKIDDEAGELVIVDEDTIAVLWVEVGADNELDILVLPDDDADLLDAELD